MLRLMIDVTALSIDFVYCDFDCVTRDVRIGKNGSFLDVPLVDVVIKSTVYVIFIP
jgi:hypothetical protein